MGEEILSWIIPLIIMLAAASIKSATGFGGSLIAAPLLMILYGKEESIPALIALWLPIGLYLSIKSHHDANWRRVLLLLGGGVCGLPIGMLFMTTASKETVLLITGIASIITAVALWCGFSRPVRSETAGCLAAGLLSGTLYTTTGESGPPIVLWGVNQNWNPQELRANLILYFTMASIIGLVLLKAGQLLTPNFMFLGLKLVPGAIAGMLIGARLAPHLKATRYKRIALTLITSSGILAIWHGV